LRIEGKEALGATVSHVPTEDLDPGLSKKYRHQNDIHHQSQIFLNIDMFQRGIGGTNSWGALPLRQYRYDNKDYSFTYKMSLVQ